MASLPNPVSFEGFIVGTTAISSRVPRPGPQPDKSLMSALAVPDNGPARGSGDTQQMSSAMDRALNPDKLEIHDLSRSTADPDPDLPSFLSVHFNPAELKKSIDVVWNEIAIPGLSHSRLQYSHTSNVDMRFDLHFDALQSFRDNKIRGTVGPNGTDFANRFLESLCYSKANPQSIRDGAPPRVLFKWPNFMSLTCVISKEEWTYSLFFGDGTPRRFTCSMSMKEIRDVRLSSSDVLRGGSKRNTDRPADKGIILA